MTIPSWLRAALITAAQSFAGTVLVALLGVLDQVREWTETRNPPDLSAFGSVVVGAATAAAAGVITAIVRAIKPPEHTYTPGDH